jgi:hypothetical protein
MSVRSNFVSTDDHIVQCCRSRKVPRSAPGHGHTMPSRSYRNYNAEHVAMVSSSTEL